MVLKRTGKYVYSEDGIYFYSGEHNSRVEAEEAGKDCYNNGVVFVGEVVEVSFEKADISMSPVEKIVDTLSDFLYEEVGDCSETWGPTDAQESDLVNMVSDTIMEWIEKHNLQPSCTKVIDVMKI